MNSTTTEPELAAPAPRGCALAARRNPFASHPEWPVIALALAMEGGGSTARRLRWCASGVAALLAAWGAVALTATWHAHASWQGAKSVLIWGAIVGGVAFALFLTKHPFARFLSIIGAAVAPLLITIGAVIGGAALLGPVSTLVLRFLPPALVAYALNTTVAELRRRENIDARTGLLWAGEIAVVVVAGVALALLVLPLFAPAAVAALALTLAYAAWQGREWRGHGGAREIQPGQLWAIESAGKARGREREPTHIVAGFINKALGRTSGNHWQQSWSEPNPAVSAQQAALGQTAQATWKPPSKAAVMQRLNEYPVLGDAKRAAVELVTLAEHHARRAKTGKSASMDGFNLALIGEPGTGRELVARLLVELYQSVGVCGANVSTMNASDLWGNPPAESLTGGALILRGAEGLASTTAAAGAATSSGQVQVSAERLAIRQHGGANELRDILDAGTVVFLLGDEAGLRVLWEQQPDIAARFTRHIRFASYTPDELLSIAEHMARAESEVFTEDAKAELSAALDELYRSRGDNWGNADEVAALLGEIREHQRSQPEAARNVTKRRATQLTLADVRAGVADYTTAREFGKDATRPLAEVMEEVDGLIGLDSLKTSLHREVRAVQAEKLKREDDSSYEGKRLRRHNIYGGPPGTGKTTVAKLHGEVYAALDISNGKFGATTASELLSDRIGGGRENTRAFLAANAGGTAFIDEFGAVTEAKHSAGDLGQEVITELLNWAENKPECPNIIIGDYPERIDSALAMNDGLASRFRRRYVFEGYNPVELTAIAMLEATKDRHRFSSEAEAELGRSLAFLHAKFSSHPAWSNGRIARKMYEESKGAQAEYLAERVASNPAVDRRRIEAADVRDGLREFLASNQFPASPTASRNAA